MDTHKHFWANSTVHGYPNIVKSKGWFKKLVWLLACLIASSVLLFQVVSLAVTYFQYEIKVNTDWVNEREIDFPAVTICNANPAKLSMLHLSSRLSALMSSWGIDVKRKNNRRKRSATACTTPVLPETGSCYWRVATTKSRANAQSDCATSGGRLASVKTQQTENFLSTHGFFDINGHMYIGLNDIASEGNWMWDDGTAFTNSWNNWESGNPSTDTGANCVTYTNADIWRQVNCDLTKKFICESIPEVATTMQPFVTTQQEIVTTQLNEETTIQTTEPNIVTTQLNEETTIQTTEPNIVTTQLNEETTIQTTEPNIVTTQLNEETTIQTTEPNIVTTQLNEETTIQTTEPNIVTTQLNGETTIQTTEPNIVTTQLNGETTIQTTEPNIVTTQLNEETTIQTTEPNIVTTQLNKETTVQTTFLTIHENQLSSVQKTENSASSTESNVMTTSINKVSSVQTTEDLLTIVYTTKDDIVSTAMTSESTIQTSQQKQDSTVGTTYQNIPYETSTTENSLPTVQTTSYQYFTSLDSQKPTVQTNNLPDIYSVVTTTTNIQDQTTTTATQHTLSRVQQTTDNSLLSTTTSSELKTYLDETSSNFETTVSQENVTTEYSAYPVREEPLREDFRKESDFMEDLANEDMNTKKQIGYQINEFISDCQYQGRKCDASDFGYLFDASFGNCYAFNSGWNWNISHSFYKTANPGAPFGAEFVLNINQKEYIDGVGDAAGAVIVVHSQSRMPFPGDEGILIVPGHITSIAISKVHISRLSGDYGICVDTSETNLTSNVFQEYYPVRYSIQACYETCYQRYVIENCYCADPQYPMYGEAFPQYRYVACDNRKRNQDLCMYDIERRYVRNELKCDCPQPCSEELFSIRTTKALWPPLKSTNASLLGITKSDTSTAGNIKDYISKNMMKVQVYFEQLNMKVIEEQPKYLLARYWIDVGAALCLWLGCSLITVCEFMEYVFIDIILERIKDKFKDSQVQNSTQDHRSNMPGKESFENTDKLNQNASCAATSNSENLNSMCSNDSLCNSKTTGMMNSDKGVSNSHYVISNGKTTYFNKRQNSGDFFLPEATSRRKKNTCSPSSHSSNMNKRKHNKHHFLPMSSGKKLKKSKITSSSNNIQNKEHFSDFDTRKMSFSDPEIENYDILELQFV